jgi:hypothetical protein
MREILFEYRDRMIASIRISQVDWAALGVRQPGGPLTLRENGAAAVSRRGRFSRAPLLATRTHANPL